MLPILSVELMEAPVEAVESPQAGAQMVRQAYKLVVDLMKPKPWVYWTDLLVCAALGWGTLLIGASAHGRLAVACFIVSALALYRASHFIHELTHLKAGSVPNFEAGWNVVIGVPLLLPSFFYVGVHHLHHARSRYGTAEDPEYLPLAHRSPFNLVVFLIAAALLPVALIGRFLILAPLSLLHRTLRELTVTRASALAINPAFRRRWPTGQDLVNFHRQEIAATAWAFVLAGLLLTHIIPWHGFFYAVGIAATVGFVNQIRTAAAHLFENEGGEMTIEQQQLDSVNVPGNPLITTLWAPGGASVPRRASSAAGAALSLAGCRPPPIAGRATGRFAVPPDRGERTLADSGPAVQEQRPQRWRCACSRRDAVGTSRS